MRATEHNDYVDYLNSQLSVLRQYITLPADTAQQMLDIFSMPAPVVKGFCDFLLQHHYHSPFDLGQRTPLPRLLQPEVVIRDQRERTEALLGVPWRLAQLLGFQGG